jgi:hypothetical protein
LSTVQAPFREVPGHDAAGLEVGGAALGHLQVVDPGQLRVLAAGGISSLEQRGAQQGGPGFAHWLALAVGLPGLAGPRGEPGIGLEPGPVEEAARTPHDRDQDRGADLGEPGQGPGQLPRIGLLVVLLAGNHLIPYLGAAKLKKLTADELDTLMDDRAEELSTRTLRLINQILERAIRHAQARDKVRRNVASLILVPEGQEGRPSKAMTLDQAVRLLDHIGMGSKHRLAAPT